MTWGGEFEASGNAQSGLARQLPLSFIVMVLISMLLFNALRQPLIVWLLVPMAVNGVVIGLLGTGVPFSFTALLGLLSLSGMLIKNGIVLVEEIDLVRREGKALKEAIVRACTSRLRPVILADGHHDPRHDATADRRFFRFDGDNHHERTGLCLPPDAGGGACPLLRAVCGRRAPPRRCRTTGSLRRVGGNRRPSKPRSGNSAKCQREDPAYCRSGNRIDRVRAPC